MPEADLNLAVASALATIHGKAARVLDGTIEVGEGPARSFTISDRLDGVSVVSPRLDGSGRVESITTGRVRDRSDVDGLARDIAAQVARMGAAPRRPDMGRPDAPRFDATAAIMAALASASDDVRFRARHGSVGIAGLPADLIESDDDAFPVVAVGEHGAWVVCQDGDHPARDHEMVGQLVEDAAAERDARRPSFTM